MIKDNRPMRRQKLWIVLLATFLIVLSSCDSKESGDPEIYLGGEVIENDDQIVIEGESNLLEDARVNGEVLIDDEEEVFSDATELTNDKGDFNMELDHPEFGEAVVMVTFNSDDQQEEEIIDHYGENGNEMTGPYTYIAKHRKDAPIKHEARVELAINEDNDEKKHEFTAPEWKDRPEDYGDPRVWIEVTDVTEDGEYFYITGESNLVEGTQLEASHHNRTSTRVHPDGTFDFKLEYHYEEDEPIAITFKPINQWGYVYEQYGRNGEKLVGNLVVQSGSDLELEYLYEYEE